MVTILKSLTENMSNTNERRVFLKQKRLVREFVYLYKMQCKGGTIKPKKRMEELKHTNGYDQDVVRILSLMQLLHKHYGKKIITKQLILIWGDAFNEECNIKYKFWKPNLRNIVRNQKKLYDYERYLDNHSLLELEGNSFAKYKGTALKYNGTEEEKKDAKDRYISFLKVILHKIEEVNFDNISDRYLKISQEHRDCLKIFEEGFINFINSLNLPDKKKKGEANIDMFRRKHEIPMPFDYCGEHGENVNENGYIDILLSEYSSIFYKGLGFK